MDRDATDIEFGLFGLQGLVTKIERATHCPPITSRSMLSRQGETADGPVRMIPVIRPAAFRGAGGAKGRANPV
jgi:hypothetical protein